MTTVVTAISVNLSDIPGEVNSWVDLPLNDPFFLSETKDTLFESEIQGFSISIGVAIDTRTERVTSCAMAKRTDDDTSYVVDHRLVIEKYYSHT